MTLQTRFTFTLPRGYVDGSGTLHREGTMRLATARDELEPLRDPSVDGPDDPRLTVVVLARVIESLGSLELVTTHEVENLFAADLAFLQDFYGVINFGTQEEYEELLALQRDALAPIRQAPAAPAATAAPTDAVPGEPGVPATGDDQAGSAPAPQQPAVSASVTYARRTAVEEIPQDVR
ncbi:hypothetical protein Sked_26540 [Sanguibacter keddieii DSM 10542]|uniref:Uncharacterized protein n=1 Tax=Sanguibacter keddieii (strain ATCC 51767 / DSM 10542 / NCFB 3025 / ST-74) TaxID=446469 RepID=D1BKT1_SANKS|nr:hypothetical protein [Sanguibacter keddieii]ACZ22558.1 hypothetical protein Sked_26540 [Sanguibacter keddieii DSM 10542]